MVKVVFHEIAVWSSVSFGTGGKEGPDLLLRKIGNVGMLDMWYV